MWFPRFTPGFAVAALLTTIYAQQTRPPASTFYLEETETQFSLSLDRASPDVYIYLSSPAYSWVGFGIGAGMKNALMFIVYPSADGSNLTLSPRLSHPHSEPVFTPSLNLTLLPGTGIHASMLTLHALCSNCRVWPHGFLDATSSSHPMSFAFGPATRLQSDDRAAPLKRHARYGTFDMDMVAASGVEAGVPVVENGARGVSGGALVKDGDGKGRAHAVVGCVALFVGWPVGVVVGGFFRDIRVHVGVGVGVMGLLVVAVGLGVAVSGEFVRSKSYTSPHQLLAFISLLPLILLAILPSPPLKSLLPTLAPKLHTPLASLAFTLLVLSGGLGLRLGAQPTPIILAYAAVALLVAAFIALVTLCVRRRGSAYARAATRRRLGEEDESDFSRAKWGVRKKLSGSSMGEEGRREGQGQGYGHERSGSAGSWREVVGGGTMPGPQYLMNMHPGVPVYVK